ncbi:MAG TPA: Calx-beta domain-containing protein [Sphingobacteriaceae bacterium]
MGIFTWHCNVRSKFGIKGRSLRFFIVWLLVAGFIPQVFGEGSKELIANGGDRVTLSSTAGSFATQGLVRVYVNENETIYLGSSTGNFVLISPTGKFYSFTTSTNNNNNLFGKGKIQDTDEEAAGPAIYSDKNDYNNSPLDGYWAYTHTAAEAGIWSVFFLGENQYFDVSVSATSAANLIKGRAYMNVLGGNMESSDYKKRFYGIFYVLTNDGYIYKVDANGLAGAQFTFFSNNKGYKNTDGTPSYQSVAGTFNNDPVLTNNLHDPRRPDVFKADGSAADVTHKLFFNEPAADLPAPDSAVPIWLLNNPNDSISNNDNCSWDWGSMSLVCTATGGTNSTTWLKTTPPTPPAISNFTFVGKEGTPNQAGSFPLGGTIGFHLTQPTKYAITIDLPAPFTDVTLEGEATAADITANSGNISVYWDGKDGSSQDFQGVINISAINVGVRAGEVHFPYIDVENNTSGIKITRLGGGSQIYWDDSAIGGADYSSIGQDSQNGAHIWGDNNNPPNNFDGSDFGNDKGIDTWSYLLNGSVASSVPVNIVKADLQATLAGNKAGYCIGETITYTITFKNNGPDNVNDAKILVNLPAEISITDIDYTPVGGISTSNEVFAGANFTASLDITSGSVLNALVTGTVISLPSDGRLDARAVIVRPADVYDPDATNPDNAPPVDPSDPDFSYLAECDAGTIGCNNVVTHSAAVSISNISISPASFAEGTNGINNMPFTVTVSPPNPNCDITVDYSISHGSTSDDDFTGGIASGVKIGTVTIPAGAPSATFDIPVGTDQMIEAAESFTVNLSNISGGASIIGSSAIGTILNDDSGNIMITSVNGAEDVGPDASFTFSFPPGITSDSDTHIAYTIPFTAGDAIGGTVDYIGATSGTITIPAGTPSFTFTLPVQDDIIVEGAETVTINTGAVASPYGIIVTNSTQALTIYDDDEAVIISNPPVVTEGKDGTTQVIFTVTLDSQTTGPFSVEFTTEDGTAETDDNDYQFSSGQLNFSGNAGESHEIIINVIGDKKIERDETFKVLLSNLFPDFEGALKIQGSPANITILDDDNLSKNKIITVTPSDGDETGPVSGSFIFSFPDLVSADTPTDIQWALNGTSNVGNIDYTGPMLGTITIPAGFTRVSLTLPVNDDFLAEGNETIEMSINNPPSNNRYTGLVVLNEPKAYIIDNDAASVSLSTGATVNESAGTATFTVTLTGDVQDAFTVDYSTINGTATQPGDYTGATGTLTFPAGSVSGSTQIFTVPLINDGLVEAGETFSASLSNIAGPVTIGTGTASTTILDNDAASVAISTNATVNEAAGTATFTVTLSGSVQDAFTVDYATTDGTAKQPGDYTGIPLATLTFPSGSVSGTTQSFTVPVVNDGFVEAGETFSATLSNITGLATISTATASTTILDNDAASVSLSTSPTVNEAAGTATFTVTLTGDVQDAFAVTYVTTDGTAKQPGDYSAGTGTVSFAAGSMSGSSQTFTVAIINDNLVEPDETFSATLTGITGLATIATATSSTRILDNDAASVAISTSAAVNEAAGTATFTVTLMGDVQEAFTVDYTTTDGTAKQPADYDATNGQLTFPAGSLSGSTQSFTVPLINDGLVEAGETFGASLNNITGSVTIGTTTVSTTIVDNDAASVAISTSPVVNESAGTATFTVTLTGGVQEAFTVDYATTDGTALEPGDYTGVTGTVTFPAGSVSGTTQNFTVPVANDGFAEADETFSATLSNITGLATIVTATATTTIVDGGVASVAISTSPTVNEGAGTAVFTVTLTGDVQDAFTVDYATINGTAIQSGDFTGVTGSVTFPAGSLSGATQAFTVTIANDNFAEGNETFSVSLSSITGPVTIGTGTASTTIVDNDVASVAIFTDATVNEATGTATFTVTLTGSVQDAFTVDYATTDGTAKQPGDYTGASLTTLTFPAGSLSGTSQTFTVPIVNDGFAETGETFSATLSNITGLPTIGTAIATTTILDNDAASVSLSTGATVNESAGTATFPVTFTGDVQDAFTVDYSTINGTATQPGDYTGATGTLTFPAGSVSGSTQIFLVTIANDNVSELKETLKAILSNASGLALINIHEATTSIVDDDMGIITVTKSDGAEEGELNAAFTFAFKNGKVSTGPTVVTYTLDGTALPKMDYLNGATGTLVIPAGENSVTLTLPVIDDQLMEGDETVTLTVDNVDSPYGITVSSPLPVATIKDNDTGAVLTLSDPVFRLEGNSGTSKAVFSVVLNNTVGSGFKINYRTADGTAKAFDGDYLPTAGTLEFDGTAGETKTFEVEINGDLNLEDDEEFTVLLTGLTNSFGGKLTMTRSSATGKIIDDDTASITITKADGEEGGNAPTFTFSFPPGVRSTAPTTISYILSGSAAAGGVDYLSVRSGQFVIPAGWNSATLTLPVVDDDITEGLEDVTLHTTLVSNRQAGAIEVLNSPQTLTIDDNDEAVLMLVPVTLAETNVRSHMARFKVVLKSATAEGFTVRYATADGTAKVSDDDYTETVGAIFFAGTAGEEIDIEVPVTGDINIENSEFFTVTLSDLSQDFEGRLMIAGSPARGVIQNDDIPPVAVADVVQTMEDTPATFNLIANDSDPDGSVDPGTIVIVTQPQHGTVKVNADGTITYTPDRDFNGTDRFSYAVKDNTGILSNVAVVEINIPAVNDTPLAEDDSFDVELDTKFDGCVCSNDSDPDGDKLRFTALTDPANGTLEFRPDGTFTYTPVSGFTGVDSFSYEACDPYGSCSTATVTLNVHLTTIVKLTPETSTVDEGKRTEITVTLVRPFDDDVTVVLGFAGSATHRADYSLSGKFQTILIPKGQTSTTEKLIIAALADGIEETDEEVIVKITSVSSPFVKVGSDATVVIKDRPFDPNQTENPDLIIEPLVSPNGDGQGNDFFHIRNIESFPDNDVVIYNRLGNEVFKIKGYDESDNVFKGTANTGLGTNGSPLVDGVYYYMITTRIDVNGKTVTRLNKGYLILRR